MSEFEKNHFLDDFFDLGGIETLDKIESKLLFKKCFNRHCLKLSKNNICLRIPFKEDCIVRRWG